MFSHWSRPQLGLATHAVQEVVHRKQNLATRGCVIASYCVDNSGCPWTGETNMKYDLERNPVEKCWTWKWKIGRREVENWPKGEKRLHSRTQWTYARVVTEKVGVHVLTIPIMCTFTHFLCIFLPQSTSKPQFPCFWHFVLPTHNTVSWGTWLHHSWQTAVHWLPRVKMPKGQ